MSVTYASSKNVASKTNPNSEALTTYNTWVRPADWLTLPTVGLTDQIAVGLYAVFNNGDNFVALSATVSPGNYTVDWGDGTIDTANISGSVAQHQYNYASISSGTLSTRGYKQVIIQVYPTTVGSSLQTISFNQKYVNTPALARYNANWLDITVGSPNFGSVIVTPNGSVVSAHLLEQFTLVSKNSAFTDFTDFFYYCYGLRKFNVTADMSNVTSIMSMFYNCINIEEIPYFDTSNVTNMTYTFASCQSLRYVPRFNTSKVTNMLQTFNGCYNIVEIPPMDIANVTNMPYTFANCFSLTQMPYLNTIKVTDMSNMHLNNRGLITLPTYNTANVTLMNSTFSNCVSLTSVPQFNTANVTSMVSTFNSCASLKEIPLINTVNVTDFTSTFASCVGLTVAPTLNTSNATSTISMFSSCAGLRTTPNYDLSKVTSANSMFLSCSGLNTTGTLTTTSNLQYTATMFSACSSLEGMPLFDVSNVVTSTSMFSTCTNLKSESLPAFNFANVTSAATMFNGCYSLVSIPVTGFTKAVTITSMFNTANSLTSLPAFNFSNATTATSLALSCNSLGNVAITGLRATADFSNNLMSQTALETLFTNLGTPVTTQTITITGNYGADTAIAKTGTWTTASKNVTITVAGSVNTGMYMYSAQAIQAIACSFTDAGDIVTLTGGSGIAPVAGTLLSFLTIVNTSGIAINTLYYVINPSGATFQLALTPGGSAIALTTNGTGTVRYALKVTGVAGTTITLDNYPMVAGTGLAVTFRVLNTNIAQFKLWTVTG